MALSPYHQNLTTYALSLGQTLCVYFVSKASSLEKRGESSSTAERTKAMAACGSLQQMFESPLPEIPTTLLEPFSTWNQIQPLNPPSIIHQNDNSSSFTEIFGELHFKENNISPAASSLDFYIPRELPQAKIEEEEEEEHEDNFNGKKSEEIICEKILLKESLTSTPPRSSTDSTYNRSHKSSDSFSSMNSESLQLCTEGLGFESSDEVEELITSSDHHQDNWQINSQEEKVSFAKQNFPTIQNINCCSGEFRRSRTSVGGFPPPISCISKSGKPWVCFKSYRHDGRFVLKEIRMPTQEFLHACREDGRLKLHFVMPDNEVLGEEDDDDIDEEDEEKEEGIEEEEDDDKLGEQENLKADTADEISEVKDAN